MKAEHIDARELELVSGIDIGFAFHPGTGTPYTVLRVEVPDGSSVMFLMQDEMVEWLTGELRKNLAERPAHLNVAKEKAN